MTAPMMSSGIDPVKARERRVLIGGTVVLVLALLLTRVLMPQWRAWQQRETRVDAATARLSQLQGLVRDRVPIERAADDAERTLAGAPRRVMHAPSLTLAASAVQSLLQDAVDGAGMVVNRVEVSSDADSTGALVGSLSAYGDIHGVSALLHTISHGPRVAIVERVAVQQTSALRGAPDVLQVQLTVRAPVLIDAPSTTAGRGGAR